MKNVFGHDYFVEMCNKVSTHKINLINETLVDIYTNNNKKDK